MSDEKSQNDVAEHEEYLTFGILWLPFIHYTGNDASIMDVDSIS